MVNGNWDTVADSEFVINKNYIQEAINRKTPKIFKHRSWISVDPAWLGKNADEIVIYAWRDGKIIDKKFFQNRDGDFTASETYKLAVQYDAALIVVDAIGVGASVVDNLRRLIGKTDYPAIKAINSASREFSEDQTVNE